MREVAPQQVANAGVRQQISSTTAGQDQRIDPSEIKRWATELNVPAPELRDAIENVGSLVNDVKRFLENAKS